MSSQASLIATPTLAPRPASSGLRGEVVPLRPAAWQPARYEPSRPRGLAMIGAGAAVGALLVAFLSLGIVAAKPRHQTLTAVRLSADLTPPPPPPQAAQQPPRAPVQPASPIVAPPPPITLALPAPTIATAPVAAPVVVPAPAPAAAPAPVAAPAPAPAAPAIATGRDLSANLVEASPPRYPIDSRRAREQGTVVLNVTVGLDGRVAEIGLSRSSGFDRLDRAALAAVRHWRWTPTRQNGQTVMVQGLVSIPFVLQG